ncbi:DNA polymerase III subunit delta [Methylobacterium sp. WL30]|uniref:DNA polymerase III subunit delta n=1 Tax=unclassified Methylobacterium TaxID=2615210 RepID=UPI0011C95BA5|nr:MULTISPECIES: DNA polymerase III subunit delta [unclassified Methylobacterium]TXM90751.1 DNA polymerase III subunit delta [Methylobacterium sp. WL116]TXN36355.1 DNA polymerase III subunit delta [Methylobacterium sp. WL93]TXN45041.1 DNA polymerase III subunit delta [Methylobacterium sp. WL119]TXN65347.1 DNA polymerase III subunit delta [Methylobacterium sp. WL30]
MTAVKAGEIDGLLRRGPDPRMPVILLFGPDTGLVAERAKQLAEGFVTDPGDPFALVRIDGDALAGDPGRLVDEAGTVGLFGDKRAIWVRPTSRPIAPAVEALLKGEIQGTRIVIEAGDLAKTAPLRTLCEKSAKALAIPCYADDARAIADLIDRTLEARGLRIDRDARTLLAESLGGDRRASLAEIEKLALYAAGTGTVGLDDVEAVVSDVAGSQLNTLIDAAFAGQGDMVERDIRRFRHEGLDPSAMLGSGLRHALQLLAVRIEGGDKAPSLMVASWRGLHFKRKGSIETQLARWSPNTLRQAVQILQDAILACRRSDPVLAHAHASSALLRIATQAARRRG